MASTYSPNLRLELIGTGEQQGTWGTTTNTNLGTLIEEAIGGYVSVTVSDVGDTTLTTNNGSADQSRNMTINLTGTITAARNVICPAIEKVYIVKNATTGGFAVTFKVSGQTGVSIPNGSTYILAVTGTDATLAGGTMMAQNSNNVSITGGSITGITDLAVADGGTGASNASSARTNLGAAASGANTDITSVLLSNTGLTVYDTDASHKLSIVPGSNLTANRTFTVTTGDADRTLSMSGDITAPAAATISGTNTGDQNTFSTISVSGQSDVVADSGSDTLTLVAGTGMTITTSAPGDSITFAASASATPDYIMQKYTSPATWTKPAGLVAVKVTVIGGGGGNAPTGTKGGAGGGGTAILYLDAPAIPGPQPVTVGSGGPTTAPTVGGTSSFGALASATGGAAGSPGGGAGGSGASGTVNVDGGQGGTSFSFSVGGQPATIATFTGNGGNSIMGQGGSNKISAGPGPAPVNLPANAGLSYGGGASGVMGPSSSGAAGAGGIVIVEEFY